MGVEDLKCNLVELRDRITADLSRGTKMVGNSLGAFLQATTDSSSLMVHFSNDKDRANNTRRQTLQNYSLVVVNRDLGPIICEGDGIWRGRRIISLGWRWRR
jgi:hypothetical protein